MSSSISIQLWICMLVFFSSCYRGQADFFFKDGLMVNYTDWYLHLKTKDLDDYIQTVVNRSRKREYWVTYLQNNLNMDIETPEHGLLIDSQLSEELYSLYWHAQIISETSSIIGHRELNTDGGQCAIDLSKVKLDKTSLGKICLSMYYNKTACVGMNLKYRSPDGSCNNLKRSYSGKASTAYKRLLFNNYRDSFIGKFYRIIIYLCAYLMMGFHLLQSRH
ncbi:uncharacterized protein LOC115033096 [Acyrthosiphon pisum]|uniref:Lipocalin n=1 Tax=Acyrthosiphon pisum TaxID=7029 RepID=A0A8R2JKZ0_ACYPI|nr:uncharacterized protein LOC115033096 [Acyrthosiphon pisum]